MTVVGLAATAAASAVSAGLAVISVTTLGVRFIRPPSLQGPPSDPAFYLLILGTIGGLLLAAAITWRLLRPIESTYRRGGLALVSAFATVLLMLVCMPVDRLLGKPGLIGLAVLCGIVALVLAGRARHATIVLP